MTTLEDRIVLGLGKLVKKWVPEVRAIYVEELRRVALSLSPELEQAEPSLRLSRPRVAVPKGEAIERPQRKTRSPRALRKPAPDSETDSGKRNRGKDYKGFALGTFVGLKRVGSDRHGNAIWEFACEHCGDTREINGIAVARYLRLGTGPTHACPVGEAATKPERPRRASTSPAAAPALAVTTHDLNHPTKPPGTRVDEPARKPRLAGTSTLVGEVFGCWEVLERAPSNPGAPRWKCRCTACGKLKEHGQFLLRRRPPRCIRCPGSPPVTKDEPAPIKGEPLPKPSPGAERLPSAGLEGEAIRQLVKTAAARIAVQHPEADRDELVEVGMAAARDAAKRFNPQHGRPFAVFANGIIRDAILAHAQREAEAPASKPYIPSSYADPDDAPSSPVQEEDDDEDPDGEQDPDDLLEKSMRAAAGAPTRSWGDGFADRAGTEDDDEDGEEAAQ